MKRRATHRGLGWLAGLLVFAALLAPSLAAAAPPLQVCPSGCTYSTIADALTAATSGATIVVAPGTYAGGLDITKNVSLLGAGAAATTISGGTPIPLVGETPVVSVEPGVTATISGFTITGDTQGQQVGGISNRGALTLRGSTVSGNSAGGTGGILNTAGATLTLASSTVSGNTGGSLAGGITSEEGATLTLASSTVSGNAGGAAAGGILNLGQATIRSSTISGNTATSGNGGGISNQGTLTITSSTVSGNTAVGGFGGGIFIYLNGTLVVKTSTISNNTAVLGGGIANVKGSVTLSGSTVTGNTAGQDGGGIWSFATNGATLAYTSTTISGNSPNDVVLA
jgi:hypothetical protein